VTTDLIFHQVSKSAKKHFGENMKFKINNLLVFFLFFTISLANAGNCVIQGNQKIGDCSNVNINTKKPIVITDSGSYSEIYSKVVIKKGGNADLSGIADSIKVESGGELFLSGISGDIEVFGNADISGTAGWITAHPKSRITISGIAKGASGSGTIIKLSGSIVGGVYKK
jgi:hypothetical protein